MHLIEGSGKPLPNFLLVMYLELPDWMIELSDEEWDRRCKEHGSYARCAKCGRRIVLVLCKHDEPNYYCFECCPEHKWQSGYDCPYMCGRCGISYISYLEHVLSKHKISFQKK